MTTWLLSTRTLFETRNDAGATSRACMQVAQLMSRLAEYNSTHVVQQSAPFDPRACPDRFNPPGGLACIVCGHVAC